MTRSFITLFILLVCLQCAPRTVPLRGPSQEEKPTAIADSVITCYFIDNLAWRFPADNPSTVYLARGSSSLDRYISNIANAAHTWNMLSKFQIDVPPNVTRIDRDFKSDATGKSFIDYQRFNPINEAGQTLRVESILHPGTVLEARIILNENVWWTSDADKAIPGTRWTDVETVLLHEFGHWLGLDHPPDTSAVMFKEYLRVRRRLTRWEEECIKKVRLYPKM